MKPQEMKKMSKDKAINGSVKVTIDREEVWVQPKDLLINGRSLADIENELKMLKVSYDDFRENTIKTLQILVVNDKQNRKNLEKQEKALADFMAQVIKGGF